MVGSNNRRIYRETVCLVAADVFPGIRPAFDKNRDGMILAAKQLGSPLNDSACARHNYVRGRRIVLRSKTAADYATLFRWQKVHLAAPQPFADLKPGISASRGK